MMTRVIWTLILPLAVTRDYVTTGPRNLYEIHNSNKWNSIFIMFCYGMHLEIQVVFQYHGIYNFSWLSLPWNSRWISLHVFSAMKFKSDFNAYKRVPDHWDMEESKFAKEELRSQPCSKVWDINEMQDLTTQTTGPCLTGFILKIWTQSSYIINTFWTLRNSLSVWRDTAHVMVSRHAESELGCQLITFLPPFLLLPSTLFPPSSSFSFLLHLLSSTHLKLVFTDLLAS